jgi:gamma-glutamylcysteine synthetase
MFVRRELPAFVNCDALHDLVKNVLDLAREGLRERGHGEERMLDPLYDRLEKGSNPAKHVLELRKQGADMQQIILEYGQLG